MKIEVKNKEVLMSLLAIQYDSNLLRIFEDIISIVNVVNITKNIIITEGWRPGSGVHSTFPCRGLDLRSWIYTQEELDNIEKTINKLWTYDPGRPDMKCLLIHDVGQGAHIHIQSHPQTLRKD